MDRQPIISAKDVEITFSLRGRKLNAIRKCSLDLYEGETLAIVGESGSGKSVFTKNFVGMLDANGKITGGSIMFEGRDMTKFTEKDWLGVRGKKIAMVMQDPMTSLNPVFRIGAQIDEVIALHEGEGKTKEDIKKRTIEMLETVGIANSNGVYEMYPHELSGGMRQRAALLRTYLAGDRVALLDEPFSALVTITKSAMHRWYLSVMEEIKLSTIFITHDIDEAVLLSDRILILSGRPGKITHQITIAEPKPRRRDFNLTPEFLDYKKQVIDALGVVL